MRLSLIITSTLERGLLCSFLFLSRFSQTSSRLVSSVWHRCISRQVLSRLTRCNPIHSFSLSLLIFLFLRIIICSHARTVASLYAYLEMHYVRKSWLIDEKNKYYLHISSRDNHLRLRKAVELFYFYYSYFILFLLLLLFLFYFIFIILFIIFIFQQLFWLPLAKYDVPASFSFFHSR